MTNIELRDLLTHYPNDCEVVMSMTEGEYQVNGVQWEPNTNTLEIFTLVDEEGEWWNVDP